MSPLDQRDAGEVDAPGAEYVIAGGGYAITMLQDGGAMCLSIGMGGSTGGGAGGFGGLPLGLAPALATPGERLVLPSGAYSRLSCLAIGDFHAVACVEHGPGGGLATLDSLPPPSAAPVGMIQHQQRSPPTVPPPRDPPFDYPRTPYDGTTMMATTPYSSSSAHQGAPVYEGPGSVRPPWDVQPPISPAPAPAYLSAVPPPPPPTTTTNLVPAPAATEPPPRPYPDEPPTLHLAEPPPPAYSDTLTAVDDSRRKSSDEKTEAYAEAIHQAATLNRFAAGFDARASARSKFCDARRSRRRFSR